MNLYKQNKSIQAKYGKVGYFFIFHNLEMILQVSLISVVIKDINFNST